ncbi:N-acetylglucosamine kinase [Saccharothrix syringae]|uniref:ATPase n=1 Tax=Saccharothrix syringae TaxID=103733 RepID=A0A5Q0GQR5_SACSY|nr:BadF/BadG/BcrA/BcrD ATPase family protein [Saccharothrix syringae]QFZ16417.1 ATPase [Saccharothrix syringae]
MGFVVGLDGGGTSTRAVVLDLAGERVGAGVTGGANPNSHPPAVAAGNVREALVAALAGVDPAAVEAGVLGMAGSGKVLSDPVVGGLFEAAWRGAGLRCPLRVVTDCEVAFASGSGSPDGTVLVAGTGSVAARVENHSLVSTAGGYGWLLGDEGSAFWLGREAVRAALGALERGGADELTAAVLERAGVGAGVGAGADRERWRRLITAVNAGPPVGLARYAPLVTAHAGAPSAERIIGGAVEVLVGLAEAVRVAGETTPVVLVGSLVRAEPLGSRLRRELGRRTGGPVVVASDGAAGAAWLAAVEVLGEGAPRPV